MTFVVPLDIQNRACQHLGASRIANIDEDSVNNAETTFAYGKLRRAELRRNMWKFAIKKAVLRPINDTTFLMAPALWNAGIQYLPGSVVSDVYGQLWVSTVANNIGNDPNITTGVWDSYYGSMSVDVYDSTGNTSYFAGDLVYIQNANSSYTIYLSLQNANTEAPNVADAWDATLTYQQDETVSYGGSQWRSLIALNTNNTPVAGPANWVATGTYNISDTVTGTDGFKYSSAANGNIGNNPVTDSGANWVNTGVPTAWTATPVIPASSTLWVPLYASLVSFNFVYPIGAGPLSQSFTKNVFRMPAGFLRKAPQDPKCGINSFLGGPSNSPLDDWELEGDYLISQISTPIILRFVADIINVREMDDLFCEGLGCRVAVETCETITNSNTKQQTCINMYQKFMGEARAVNAIETGPVEPPEDEYLSCRR